MARLRGRYRVPLALVLGLALAVQACSDEGPVESSQSHSTGDPSTSTGSSAPDAETQTDVGNDDVGVEPVSFGQTVAPVLADKCAVCHNAGGAGSPHWQLETAADVEAFAPFIGARVSAGEMPPWPAGPLSLAFHDDRSLDDDQRAAILAWVDEGGEIDVEPSTPIVVDGGIAQLDEVDIEMAPAEPYDGSPENEDDYRCLVYDPELEEDVWLTGYAFIPDRTEVVHHAIGYRIAGDRAAAAVEADAADPGPGWECYGSSGLGVDELVVGWAPGQEATDFAEGAGLRLHAGDFFVVQIHYHFDVDAPADSSLLQLDITDGAEDLDPIGIAQYVAPAEIPCTTEETGPLCDREAAFADAVDRFGARGVQANGINLLCRADPADFAHMTDGVATSSCDLPAYSFGEVLAVLGHEHEIGASFRMTLNPDGPDEQILLDIPDWDFDWQYNYRPVEPVMIEPGDVIRIECSWDRSRRNPDLEPRYILWADGTNDEMCFSTIAVRQ